LDFLHPVCYEAKYAENMGFLLGGSSFK
jgi:hypothetical protein